MFILHAAIISGFDITEKMINDENVNQIILLGHAQIID